METQRRLRGLLARLLIAAATSTGASLHAHAGAITTEAAVASDRERILVLLDRPDVSAQLEAYGVKAADAKARIAALTDAEVAQLADGIDTAPAGGFVQAIAMGVVAIGYVIAFVAVLVVRVVAGGIQAMSRGGA